MKGQLGTTRTGRVMELAAAILLALVMPLGLYLLAALAAANADGSTLVRVACFEPARIGELSVGRMAAAAVMAVSAVGFLFVVPGLLGTLAFMRLAGTRPTAYAWSLAANSAALVLMCLVLRNRTVEIGRVSFLVAWLAWTAALFALAWQPGKSWATLSELRRRYGSGLLVGLLTVLLAITVFFPEQFVQCFSEDGTETYEVARSLRSHFLPYWELETWQSTAARPGQPIPESRMGTVVVNPSLVNSYWTCGLQTLLGDGELATRLPYWVWWLAIFAVSYRLVQPRLGKGSWLAAAGLGLTVFLISVLFTFYVGYNPYMADLANPGVPDALFTLLVLLAFDCLRQQDRWGWVISMTLASLVLYAGVVLLVLTLASACLWQPIERRETLRWGLRAGGLLLAVAAFYLGFGWLDGSLPCWVDTLDIEYVNDYLAAPAQSNAAWSPVLFHLSSALLFFCYFLLCCGGAAAIGLVWAFRRDAWQRTVATTALLYLLIVLGSGFKNLHYLGPLLPIPAILFLTAHNDGETLGRRPRYPVVLGSVVLCISLVLCIWLCWPAERATFVLNRELGMRTTITTRSYSTAVRWARLRHELKQRNVMSWDCDEYTWVAYAEPEEDPRDPRPLLLTDRGAPPAGYRLATSLAVAGTENEVRLYVRDTRWTGQLAKRHPLRPLRRYPFVFRPLAYGPYSPHNNPLEDVRRLCWPW